MTSDATFNILGVVFGVCGLLPALFTFISSQLPSNKLRKLDFALEETETLLKSTVEEGLFPDGALIPDAEGDLSRIRIHAEEVRLQSHCAATVTKQLVGMLTGLSSRISMLYQEAKQLKARISSSTAEARKRLEIERQLRHSSTCGTDSLQTHNISPADRVPETYGTSSRLWEIVFSTPFSFTFSHDGATEHSGISRIKDAFRGLASRFERHAFIPPDEASSSALPLTSVHMAVLDSVTLLDADSSYNPSRPDTAHTTLDSSCLLSTGEQTTKPDTWSHRPLSRHPRRVRQLYTTRGHQRIFLTRFATSQRPTRAKHSRRMSASTRSSMSSAETNVMYFVVEAERFTSGDSLSGDGRDDDLWEDDDDLTTQDKPMKHCAPGTCAPIIVSNVV
ncbi:uncharacterized protein FIBRA_08794 [Fibroporia radiculosa]|uniref:Uncharacterized protein n=1 Tax=Fibroporia radiculosa TaxID=599839 RepID=J4I3C1_9APHY|nr:uncharacterized protein FIBRA_08794 [Fibroporia radiculosa]CCM06522.1 predicted protein [Fibroporia radiculosa]